MSGQGCDLEDRCCEPPPLRLQTVQVKPLSVAACGTAETACCAGGVPVFDGVDPRYKRILWTVIGINGLMFLAEMVAGHLAGSQALKADALDFLAETVTYGLSLSVIGANIKAAIRRHVAPVSWPVMVAPMLLCDLRTLSLDGLNATHRF